MYMEIEEFRKDIDLAVRILAGDTRYISDRKLIDRLFENNNPSLEDVVMRLTVIDSLYSTNMSKRLFGIQDLASAIFNIGNDEQLRKAIEEYKDNKNDDTSEITTLLSGGYGVDKRNEIKKIKNKGNDKNDDYKLRARSLISKYLYFVTGHDFPIEDSLVKDNLNDVLKYYESETMWDKEKDLLRFLIFFCVENGITFDELDNFTWLLGKINKGSLSLIINKEQYQKLISKLDVKEKKSKEIDKLISTKLKDEDFIHVISEFLSSDFCDFLRVNKKIHQEDESKA